MTDISQVKCFHCRQFGHLKRSCPHRSEPKSHKPAAPAESRPPSEQNGLAAYQHLDLTRKPPEEIADYAEWGQVARSVLAAVTGRPEPSGEVVRTEGELREIARQQVEESRAGRHADL